MQETFQHEYLDGKISRIETTIPSLASFKDLPASNGIGQVFDIGFLTDRHGRHARQDRDTTNVGLQHFATQFDKVRITFPYTNRVADIAFAVNDKVLCVLAVFLGLFWVS